MTRNARLTKFFYDSATFEVIVCSPGQQDDRLLVASIRLPQRLAATGYHTRVREEGNASGRLYG